MSSQLKSLSRISYYVSRTRFSLKTLLISFTAAAVALGYFVGTAQQQKRAVAAIERLGGTVIYDYQYRHDQELDEKVINLFNAPPDVWYVNLLGRDFFHRVVGVHGYKLRYHNQSGPVYLSFGPSRLKTEFSENTDEALGSLRGLRSLLFLDLRRTSVTDAGLETLAILDGIASVTLFRTKVTDEGVRRLQEAMPDLEIRHWAVGEIRNGEWVQKKLPASGVHY